MSNSGDLLLTEIFYLLFPGVLFLATVLIIAYFYLKRFNKIIRRYKIQKLNEVENERKRIANDLHDFVASKLLKIKNELDDSLKASKDPLVYKNIAQGILDLNKFHDELRYLVEYIYPKELLSGSLKLSLIRLAEEMSNANTLILMDIEFKHQLPKEKMHQLYRLIQEKISNILVYEKPPKIFIGLFENTDDNEVLLSISYFSASKHKQAIPKSERVLKGRGMFVIQERQKLLNAKVNTEFNDGFLKESIIFPIG